MDKKLVSVILEIASNSNLDFGSEDEIKQEIVMRIFQSIGWNIFNRKELTPDYPVNGDKVDYALRDVNKNKELVFVKVIRGGTELNQHKEQLIKYALKRSVKLALLTNGKEWHIYLPRQECMWNERPFDTLDISRDDTENIAVHLTKFLSKDKVCSGEAELSAKDCWDHQRIKEYIKDTLDTPIDEERFINLIIQITEERHKIKPTEIEVREFLSEQKNRLEIPSSDNECFDHLKSFKIGDISYI